MNAKTKKKKFCIIRVFYIFYENKNCYILNDMSIFIFFMNAKIFLFCIIRVFFFMNAKIILFFHYTSLLSFFMNVIFFASYESFIFFMNVKIIIFLYWSPLFFINNVIPIVQSSYNEMQFKSRPAHTRRSRGTVVKTLDRRALCWECKSSDM